MKAAGTGGLSHRAVLEGLARTAMLERGLLPDYSAEVLAQLGGIRAPAVAGGATVRDLTSLLWCSIDNDDSLDLDQLTVAVPAASAGNAAILVAIADVDALVGKETALDAHAYHNTTSVYTAARTFAMLPEKLSTGLTSLNQGEKRLSLVVELALAADGSVAGAKVYRALVRSCTKLSYTSVAAWLDGTDPEPEAISAVDGLAANLRTQDAAAQSMQRYRTAHGALSLETTETRPVFTGDTLTGFEVLHKDRAKRLIEDFMIAANGAVARFLSSQGFPSIRRVVRSPKRWERLVEIAGERGYRLPATPDSQALEVFLMTQKAADPARFADLSLTVIKLLGPGEYAAEVPGDTVPDHFGLAARDYGHSTAPNRRYADLVTHRLVKAALAAAPVPYTGEELQQLAVHCTQQEDVANKVERQVDKSAAALLLAARIGEEFEAIVTGAAKKGTWVRLLAVPVEGKVDRGFEGLDVGQRVRVRLVSVDVDRGFVDFHRIGA